MVDCLKCSQHGSRQTPYGQEELCKLQKTGTLDVGAMKTRDCENFDPIVEVKWGAGRGHRLKKPIKKPKPQMITTPFTYVSKDRTWPSIMFIISVWLILFFVPAIFLLPRALSIIPILLELLLLIIAIYSVRMYREDHPKRKGRKRKKRKIWLD